MQSEDVLEHSHPPLRATEPKRSRKSKLLFWVHGVTFTLGLSFLIYLIYRIGYQNVLDSVSKVGWGFLAIFGLNFTRHLIRAASLYIAVEPEQRTFKYRHAAAARLGGEAVTFFSFTGPFLGDATKAVLLKRNVPLKYGASAVIIDNIAYYSSVIMMVLAGVATLIYLYGSGSGTMTNVLAGIVTFAVLMFIAIVAVVWLQIRPFSLLVNILSKRTVLPRFIAKRQSSLAAIESNVFHFYNNRRRDFFLLFLLIIVVHSLSVAEVYLVLRFLEIAGTWPMAFIIESLTKVINAVFIWFVPGTVGVYEGGNVLILNALGDTTAAGVAVAFVRRGASLMSTSVGLIILLWRGAARGARHFARDDEDS
jgi:uncharacterized membrane protein YbhN (UPF0104 family)